MFAGFLIKTFDKSIIHLPSHGFVSKLKSMEQAEGCWSQVLEGLGGALPFLSQDRPPLPWGLSASWASRIHFGESGCAIFWDAGHGKAPHLCRAGMLFPQDAASLKHPKRIPSVRERGERRGNREGCFPEPHRGDRGSKGCVDWGPTSIPSTELPSPKGKGWKADRLSIHRPWLICKELQICAWDID